jgi:hypothetical protein
MGGVGKKIKGLHQHQAERPRTHQFLQVPGQTGRVAAEISQCPGWMLENCLDHRLSQAATRRINKQQVGPGKAFSQALSHITASEPASIRKPVIPGVLLSQVHRPVTDFQAQNVPSGSSHRKAIGALAAIGINGESSGLGLLELPEQKGHHTLGLFREDLKERVRRNPVSEIGKFFVDIPAASHNPGFGTHQQVRGQGLQVETDTHQSWPSLQPDPGQLRQTRE